MICRYACARFANLLWVHCVCLLPQVCVCVWKVDHFPRRAMLCAGTICIAFGLGVLTIGFAMHENGPAVRPPPSFHNDSDLAFFPKHLLRSVWTSPCLRYYVLPASAKLCVLSSQKLVFACIMHDRTTTLPGHLTDFSTGFIIYYIVVLRSANFLIFARI